MKKKRKKDDRLCMKLSASDKKALEIRARKFTKGNLSEWLRIAGLAYAPDEDIDF